MTVILIPVISELQIPLKKTCS